MSNNQLKNMMILEGIFYGVSGICVGIIVSVVILYIVYCFIMKKYLYLFTLPWNAIIESIIVTYIVIFWAIICARTETKHNNILDGIRDDNI